MDWIPRLLSFIFDRHKTQIDNKRCQDYSLHNRTFFADRQGFADRLPVQKYVLEGAGRSVLAGTLLQDCSAHHGRETVEGLATILWIEMYVQDAGARRVGPGGRECPIEIAFGAYFVTGAAA